MKCKFVKSLSSLKEFSKDPEHKYLIAVFVPEKMGLLQTLGLGNAAQFTINLFPGRDNDNNILEDQQKALIDGYNDGSFEKEEYFVDRVQVEVPPFCMKRSRDSQFGKKGEIIKDGENPRIYTSIAITCFHKMVNGNEVPALDENALKNRANAIRNFRIKNNDWLEASAVVVDGGVEHDEMPDDSNINEEQLAAEEEKQRKLAEARKLLEEAGKPAKL